VTAPPSCTTHTLYSYTILIHYSYTILIHYIPTLYSYTILIHYIHTLYSYTTRTVTHRHSHTVTHRHTPSNTVTHRHTLPQLIDCTTIAQWQSREEELSAVSVDLEALMERWVLSNQQRGQDIEQCAPTKGTRQPLPSSALLLQLAWLAAGGPHLCRFRPTATHTCFYRQGVGGVVVLGAVYRLQRTAQSRRALP
jgi:hypothetical protein